MKASSQLHFFSRVYLKTPNVPGQWVFCGVPRHFFLKYVSIPAKKCLAQRKNPSLPITSCVFRYTLKNQRGPSFFQKDPRLLLSGISLLSLCAFAYGSGVFVLFTCGPERLLFSGWTGCRRGSRWTDWRPSRRSGRSAEARPRSAPPALFRCPAAAQRRCRRRYRLRP